MSEVTDAAYRRFDYARVAAEVALKITGPDGPQAAPHLAAKADAEAALASLGASGAVPPADLAESTDASLAALRGEYEAQRERVTGLADLPPDLLGPNAAAFGLVMANTTRWIEAIKAVEKERTGA